MAEKIIEDIKNGKLPDLLSVKLLCMKARDYIIEDPNVIILRPPLVVVGDVHGQFYDLLNIFEDTGYPPDANFCFLGDYCDRGYHGVETFIFLLALKVKYPTKMTLLRGNHESRAMTQIYGFYDECMQKYGNNIVYSFCTSVFDLLPVAATVSDELFLVHGGISPNLNIINELNKFARIHDIEETGVITDLFWSDPDVTIKNWGISSRGTGFLFGSNPVDKFNHLNDTKCIVRAHQLCQSGYDYIFNETVLTVFSAANYCYRCGNEAAILEINSEMNRDFKIFEAVANQHNDNKPPRVLSYFL